MPEKQGMLKVQEQLVLNFRQLFCDFGEEFEVTDCNGETPASTMISHIEKVTLHCI